MQPNRRNRFVNEKTMPPDIKLFWKALNFLDENEDWSLTEINEFFEEQIDALKDKMFKANASDKEVDECLDKAKELVDLKNTINLFFYEEEIIQKARRGKR